MKFSHQDWFLKVGVGPKKPCVGAGNGAPGPKNRATLPNEKKKETQRSRENEKGKETARCCRRNCVQKSSGA